MSVAAAKGRKPLSEVQQDDDMTVEQFLERQCETILDDLKEHSAALIAKLKREYAEGVKGIRGLEGEGGGGGGGAGAASAAAVKKLVVTLKVATGPHVGQKFRLEPATEDGEDVFKIGRSTGKVFKEKGVSLYKDKEISTSHGKVEIKNGQVFLIDTKSTNGTSLNGVDVEPNVPLRLNDGDVVTVGGSELQVHIAEQETSDEENYASV